jgi:hypothetical protein
MNRPPLILPRHFLLFLVAVTASITLTAQEEFDPLFDGRTLDGWINVNCAPETWSVRDGVILCTGFPTGALRTDRQYENFILELEWRHLKSGGNAGVFIWAGPIAAPGVPFLRAIEVQVLDHGYNANGKNQWYTTHGDVFPIHGSTMEPHGRSNGMRSFPSEERSKPSPEWNHYRIECLDGVLRLQVNGKEVSGGSRCNWHKGYIALESEGSPVEFRNIRIHELPATGATANQSAPIAQGHQPLYNGLDLRGWKADPELENLWQPSDWRLVCGKSEPGEGTVLWTERRYAAREWMLDFKIPGNADWNSAIAGICMKGGNSPLVLIGKGRAPVIIERDQAPPDKWHRLTIRNEDGERRLLLNGEPLDTLPLEDARAATHESLGLLRFGQPLEFANLYVLE